MASMVYGSRSGMSVVAFRTAPRIGGLSCCFHPNTKQKQFDFYWLSFRQKGLFRINVNGAQVGTHWLVKWYRLFAKAPNEWTQAEHNMCGRRTPWSPLRWWPCFLARWCYDIGGLLPSLCLSVCLSLCRVVYRGQTVNDRPVVCTGMWGQCSTFLGAMFLCGAFLFILCFYYYLFFLYYFFIIIFYHFFIIFLFCVLYSFWNWTGICIESMHSLLPVDEAIAYRAVSVIVSGANGRSETPLEPAK